MKNYNSTDGLIWTENIDYKFSQEEREILDNPKNADYKPTVDKILAQKIRYIGEDSGLTDLVAEYMPGNSEEIRLLSINFIFYDEINTTSGIINYIINNEHKQIRW